MKMFDFAYLNDSKKAADEKGNYSQQSIGEDL